jgi:Spx/MgsR family transcriptional regulator
MTTLYGIKNCDTCKKARLWLEQNHVAFQFHEYRTDGLSEELLNRFANQLGWSTMLNRSSTSWRQLSPEQQADLTEAKALQLMLAFPTLIKRPILDAGGRLIIGFKSGAYETEL